MSDEHYMPDVDADDEVQQNAFAMAREISGNDRAVAIVTPGRVVIPFPAPPSGSMPADMVQDIQQIVSDRKTRQITVIAFNDLVMHGALTPEQATEHIPFLGYLIGMAYLGHNVIVFEGHPTALKFGCEDADLLILDQEMETHLQSNWIEVTCHAMRSASILVFGRDGSLGTVDTRPYLEVAERKPKKKQWWWFR